MGTRPNDVLAEIVDRRQAIGAMGASATEQAVGYTVTRAAPNDPASLVVKRGLRAGDGPSHDVLRHGAYVCLEVPQGMLRSVQAAAVPDLAEQLGFTNEFDAGDGHPAQAIAYLKCVSVTPAQIADEALIRAAAIVHIAARDPAPIDSFCSHLARLLGPSVASRILRGVVRPTVYTGNAMHEFAYAHQAVQQSGSAMPNAFLIPMSKIPEWWAKSWMERHTYFLPRYDIQGRMVHEGHALAAAAGIPGIMRRTYRSELQPAPEGIYEFVNYFECADAEVPTLEEVVAALRDLARNPEWIFVREGPMWRGRRMPAWPDLFA